MPEILLIDDSATAGFAIERMLMNLGWQAQWTRRPTEAVSRAEANPPDLVISDIIMPDLDGFGVCEAFGTHPSLAAVPVVLVSGRVDDEVVARGLAAGANAVIAKPLTPERIAQAVTDALATPGQDAADAGASDDVDPPAAPDLAQRLANELEPLRTLNVGTAQVADRQGRLVAAIGARRAEGQASSLAGTLDGIAAEATTHTGSRVGRLILETDDGLYLFGRIDSGHSLVVTLPDDRFLGMARSLVRRVQRRLAGVLHAS